MLDIKKIRNDEEHYIERLIARGVEKETLNKLIEYDQIRRTSLKELEDLRNKRNSQSASVQDLKKQAAHEEAEKMIAETKKSKDRISQLEKEIREVEADFFNIAANIPNIAHESVPIGESEEDNTVLHQKGTPTEFNFTPLPHYEVGINLDILDFERGTKVSGPRFVYSKGLGARLERAVYNFMLDINTKEHGYTEIIPPFLVNKKSMFGTGQFPKFKEDVFTIEDEDLVLIPTSEVPLTNYYADEIIPLEKIPTYFTALSPCFRSEAGSAGRDTRGLIRMHQFHKVEMVKYALPENSFDELEKMRENAEHLLELLELPFQTITLSTGDMGFSASKTYDLEVWFPSQNTYREISSCSNCLDFQARRANIRYRNDAGEVNYIHTLNGSGLAIGRTVAAILENYQQEDGSVKVPTVLVPYMDNLEFIS